VEVLKDVSATAIYGSRGANGVILITTKKGQRGDRQARINYTYNIGVSNISKKLDLLNASEWAQFQKDYWANKGGYTDDQIAALGKGTDWQDAVLRTALQQSHELSITGGTEKSRYAFSANYTDQDGILLNSGFERYNFHTNVEWELQKGLKFGVNATYGRSKQKGLTTTEEQVFNSSPYSAGITNSFVYALLMPPVVSVYNADGSYNFNNPFEYAYFAIGDQSANPVYDLEESVAETFSDQRNTLKIISLFTIIAIVISILGYIGMSLFFIRQRQKEIAIRKIMGGTSHEIMLLMLRTFCAPLLVSFVIAVPLSWYIMNDWLSNFSYRIALSPWMFAATCTFALVVAVLSVGIQIVKAVRTNPVESIKTE
jgi:TonB-dependent SusC/RagA subfamily outer membrane receptor